MKHARFTRNGDAKSPAALPAEGPLETLEDYKKVFAALSDAVFIHDGQTGRILAALGAVDALYGHRPEETLGMTPADASANVHPFVDETALGLIGRTLEEGPRRVEWRAKHKSGRVFWVEVRLAPAEIAGRTVVVATVRDIDDMVRGREELAANRASLQTALNWNRAVLDNSGAGILALAKGRVIVEVNPQLCKIFEYQPEEMLGRTTAFLHIDEAAYHTFGERFYSKTAEKDLVRTQWPMRAKSGRIVWCDLHGRAVDPTDLAKGVIWLVLDATERKKAEDARKLSEERLRSLIDAAPFGCHEYYLDETNALKLVGANKAADRILGIDHQTLIGRTIEEAFPALVETEAPNAYRAAAKGLACFEERIFAYKEDWIDGVFDVAAMNIGENRVGAFFRDVTEIAKAEKKLKDSEARLEAFLENAPAGVFIKDDAGRYLLVNRQWELVAAVERTKALGKTDLDLFGPEVGGLFMENDRQVLDDNKPIQFEETADFGNGLRTFLSIKFPLQSHKTLGVVVCGVILEITEQKKALADLAELNKSLETIVAKRTKDLFERTRDLEEAVGKLKEQDALKSSFLSLVSHELRTPLTAVLGFAKLIRKDFIAATDAVAERVRNAKGPRILKNLDIIVSEGERLTTLVTDVLDLNRIESGRMEWRDKQFDPAPILAKAALSAQGFFAAKPQLDFSALIPPTLPEIHLDPDKLAQVVLNLLSNAAKYADSGEVRLTASVDDAHLVISVSDQGPGVAPADQKRIFEAFQQGENDLVRSKPDGSGLGLAICREIVHHYNGRIELDPAPAQGAAFVVHLPLAET